MKTTIKYSIAAAAALLGLWLLISTWRGVQDGINGPVTIKTSVDNKPTVKNLNRWRDRSQFAMLNTVTNDVIGFRRLVDYKLSNDADAVSNWNGSAMAEYINVAGGVQRTNLFYNFSTASGEITAEPDWYQIAYTAARSKR